MAFVVEYSTSKAFDDDSVMRIDGKTSYFFSDRSMDNGNIINFFQTDVTGLQVMACVDIYR